MKMNKIYLLLLPMSFSQYTVCNKPTSTSPFLRALASTYSPIISYRFPRPNADKEFHIPTDPEEPEAPMPELDLAELSQPPLPRAGTILSILAEPLPHIAAASHPARARATTAHQSRHHRRPASEVAYRGHRRSFAAAAALPVSASDVH